jgi:uncharacterized membrane protein YdbT with pleckstrin-like domain
MKNHLQTGEKVYGEVRKHWFLLFIDLCVVGIIAVLPLLAFIIILAATSAGVSARFFFLYMFFYVAFLLCLWIVAFVRWTDYYLDVIIITDRAVTDIEQKGLFNRDIVSVSIENIQDVKTETMGLLNTFLKKGDIYIQTAGTDKEVVMRGAHDPDKAKKIIAEVQQIVRQREGKADPEVVEMQPVVTQ